MTPSQKAKHDRATEGERPNTAANRRALQVQKSAEAKNNTPHEPTAPRVPLAPAHKVGGR